VGARVSFVSLALGLVLAVPALASDSGYIYGRVTTVDRDVYEGELRWGNEESFWDDTFNATKYENENLRYLDRDQLEEIRWANLGGWDSFVGRRDQSFTHLFAVRFGDLTRIDVEDDDELEVTFRNGETMRLGDGSNDVGATVTVLDDKQGRHAVRWSRIRSVEFVETPSKLARKLGEPLYGTVKSGKYEFTGRIQWDHDECLNIDELDGETRDGDVSLEFEQIAAIRKHRNGALVTLKSGSELYLTGTNDVNDENRGVVVIVPGVGSVKVGWEDFDKVTFAEAPNTGRRYAEYTDGRDLNGTVVTRDGKYDGRIVFDLDESRDFEMLHGMNGDTEYLIPFRDIARIKPRGRSYADVELRAGLIIELEDGQDVSRKNDGLLVFTGQKKPKYVAWEDVTEVVFR